MDDDIRAMRRLHPHEAALGERLGRRLNRYLAGAGEATIPSQTLGVGVTYRMELDGDAEYDEATGSLTVRGSVVFVVKRIGEEREDEP